MSGNNNYELHTLGWKSFQDLCIAISSEVLKRPVQIFLPSKDAGRDGAFVGRWDPKDGSDGASTIQCKFTSLPHEHLSMSLLADEVAKVSLLAKRGLAEDYVILTNHPITGASEIAIAEAFITAGAKRCRIFGRDWIVQEITKSAPLRMMVPRLYGLGDLSNILDGRAYEQASMLLSAMGDDLRKLVVTESHRKSVRAVTEHNIVLLLGAPATGKSTIGASLAVGAADIWKCLTIRAPSPEYLQAHLNPNERQFFWIDDAWGSTQYQRHTMEAWNQLLPLIRGAMQRGTRFLFTSRDYIWAHAKSDLKIHSLPILEKSQVIINVQDLTRSERAQILYNHLKLGDQSLSFRARAKPSLPKVIDVDQFLPETARRFGSAFFTIGLIPHESLVLPFFARPEKFLLDTLIGLDPDARAAIGAVFLGGGRIASPTMDSDEVRLAASAFGTTESAVRDSLSAMNGSLLLLAHDENGRYWTYKHPTIGDAFAKLVASNPELVDVYIRGAKADWILQEVVCSGVELEGAPVTVPPHLFSLLLQRLSDQASHALGRFLSYRASREFAKLVIETRPDVLDRVNVLVAPISEDIDAALLVRLNQFGLVDQERKAVFFQNARRAVLEEADASLFEDSDLRALLSVEELDEIREAMKGEVFEKIEEHVSRVAGEWADDSDPENHFEQLTKSLKILASEAYGMPASTGRLNVIDRKIDLAKIDLQLRYEEPKPTKVLNTTKPSIPDEISTVFRDVDV